MSNRAPRSSKVYIGITDRDEVHERPMFSDWEIAPYGAMGVLPLFMKERIRCALLKLPR